VAQRHEVAAAAQRRPDRASWPDGASCDFASREVYRRVLDGIGELGFDVIAALEYEIRLWDAAGEPLSSGISYSLTEIGRYEGFISRLVPALEGLGVELSAVHTEAGPGLFELNLRNGDAGLVLSKQRSLASGVHNGYEPKISSAAVKRSEIVEGIGTITAGDCAESGGSRVL
jgi:hypothetical protein